MILNNLLKAADLYFNQTHNFLSLAEEDDDDGGLLKTIRSNKELNSLFSQAENQLIIIRDRSLVADIMKCFFAAAKAVKEKAGYETVIDLIKTALIDLNAEFSDDPRYAKSNAAAEEIEAILIDLKIYLENLPKEDKNPAKEKEIKEFIYSKLNIGLLNVAKQVSQEFAQQESKPESGEGGEEAPSEFENKLEMAQDPAERSYSVFNKREYFQWSDLIDKEIKNYQNIMNIFDPATEPLPVQRVRTLIDLLGKIFKLSKDMDTLQDKVNTYDINSTAPEVVKEREDLKSKQQELLTLVKERRKEKATVRRYLADKSNSILEKELFYLNSNPNLDKNERGDSQFRKLILKLKIDLNKSLSSRDYGKTKTNKERAGLLTALEQENQRNPINNQRFVTPPVQNIITPRQKVIDNLSKKITSIEEVTRNLTEFRDKVKRGELGPIAQKIWTILKWIASNKSDNVTKVVTRNFLYNKLIPEVRKGTNNSTYYQNNKESIDRLISLINQATALRSQSNYKSNRLYINIISQIQIQKNIVYSAIRENLQQEYNNLNSQQKAIKEYEVTYGPIRRYLNNFYTESSGGNRGQYFYHLTRDDGDNYFFYVNDDTDKSNIESIINKLKEIDLLNQSESPDQKIFPIKIGKMSYNYEEMFTELVDELSSAINRTKSFAEIEENLKKNMDSLNSSRFEIDEETGAEEEVSDIYVSKGRDNKYNVTIINPPDDTGERTALLESIKEKIINHNKEIDDLSGQRWLSSRNRDKLSSYRINTQINIKGQKPVQATEDKDVPAAQPAAPKAVPPTAAPKPAKPAAPKPAAGSASAKAMTPELIKKLMEETLKRYLGNQK